MKKYQVTWGWQPPQYDRPKDNFRLFFHTQEVEREVTHKDFETGEETTDTIHEWLCDVVEYERKDIPGLFWILERDKDSLECQKWILSKQIEWYDSSRHVNEFYIGGIPMWLHKADRVGLQLRLESERGVGKESTILWQDGISFPLPLVGEYTAFDMLIDIEMYASACYDNTQKHLAAIMNMTDAEEVRNYDYTVGYPEKLQFR